MVAYMLLALCMALLTVAPNYTSFGSQTIPGDVGATRCSMARRESVPACQVSVISVFFTRIALAMPFFSVAYFFANWAFVGMFAIVFTRAMFCTTRQPFLDAVDDCVEEEELG